MIITIRGAFILCCFCMTRCRQAAGWPLACYWGSLPFSWEHADNNKLFALLALRGASMIL
ncbi:MAG TPA: hypothetical protein DHV59_10640 [Oxalobacteraceae bacterium]|nr:hypothetical protein [Oxalobacteraceae bacterium]